MKANLFLVAVLGTFLFSSCAKKTDNTPSGGGSTTTYANSYTINGGDFNNVVYNISSIAQQTASYDTSTGKTTIVIQGTSGDSMGVRFDIVFAGKSARTYTLDPTVNVFTISTTPTKNPKGLEVYTSNSGGKMTITNYGSTGGTITGTFSGSFTNNLASYSITNGTFTATVQ